MNTENMHEFVQQFREKGLTHKLWQHPFFAKKFTKDDLRMWAIQAGRIDEVFAEILQNMINNPAIPPANHTPIQENLNDEMGNGDELKVHFTLFRNLLHALEIGEEEYENAPMNLGTQKIIDSLRNASLDTNNPLRILSLMASEELICPNEFPILLAELREYVDPKDLVYFDVHIEADVKHADDLIKLCYETVTRTRQKISDIFEYQEEDLNNNCEFYDDLIRT